MSERGRAEDENDMLDADRLVTLNALVDTLIPPSTDGRLPGAGAVGVAERIADAVRTDPELGRLVRAGLERLDDNQRVAGGRFAQLDDVGRAAAVTELQTAHKEAFESIVFHTCRAYYQDERVVAALGLEARPPFPKGYEVAETDPALLEPVKKRPPMYRKT
jgi:hypothetical protein